MAGYSLHIGLNRVDPAAYNGWEGTLTGCVNDARSMEQLALAAGFTPSLLLDDAATSQAVIGEIAYLAGTATAGDLCLISYSGHGGQVDDTNGDEQDSLDETWVCFDRQVVDDELAQMWSQFAGGVRVLVVSDSCHSGSVTRQMRAVQRRRALLETARAAQVPALAGAGARYGGAASAAGPAADRAVARAPMTTVDNASAAAEPAESRPRSMPLHVQEGDRVARRGTYQFVQALSGSRRGRSYAASVLALSGCQDDELSYDGDVNGHFTGALLEVWDGGSFSGDYRAFHAAIVSKMLYDQTPGLDTENVLDAGFVLERPFTPGAGPVDPGTPSEPDPWEEPSTPRPVLRRGSSGEAVEELQGLLAQAGYRVSIDGVFGPGTESAVRSFQRDCGLTADGVVGPATWEALG